MVTTTLEIAANILLTGGLVVYTLLLAAHALGRLVTRAALSGAAPRSAR